jgi:hypothetical protein
VQRGPIIFCLEQSDQPSGVSLSDVSFALTPKLAQEFQVEYKADMLDGVAVLRHDGMVYETPSAEQPLYQPTPGTPPKTRKERLALIPYYAWANREPSPMQVWIPYTRG